MDASDPIPVFTLFGETERFPDVVHCESFSARAPIHGWRISAHRHAQMAQLFLIVEGGVTAKVDGRTTSLKSGDFLFVAARIVHEFVFEPDTVGRVISFPVSVVNSLGPTSQDILAALSKSATGEAGPALFDLAEHLAETAEGTSRFRSQRAVGLAHSVLALVAEAAASDDDARGHAKGNLKIEAFDQLIHDHMAEGWSASDYGRALNVTTGHLSRLCRNAAGVGAAAYIEQTIMEEACRMLAFTQLPIAEIGYRLGFQDPSYFSKRFRAVRGGTPTVYRRQFLA